MHHGEFRHPRLVEVYDLLCPWGPDDDLYLELVAGVDGRRILDLGCGTGRLTLALARAGYDVTGVDPARASLDRARTKHGAAAVRWIEGSAEDLPAGPFDAALMTSHVSQFVVDEDDWRRALSSLHAGLVPGGVLIFDSLDPDDRRWERWTPDETRRDVVLVDGTPVRTWTEVTAVEGDPATPLVSFTHHYVLGDGTTLHGTATMRMRSVDDLREGLVGAGFVVDEVFGGWRRQAVGAGDGELVVVARRSSRPWTVR